MATRPNPPDTGVGSDRGSTTGTPRWVKAFGIIALVVVLLFVILMFIRDSPGGHGPGLHAPHENQEQEIGTDDGDGHDPSQRDHG